MKSLVIFLCVAALAHTSPVPQEESVFKLVIGNFVNCMNSDLNLCLKEHALHATERLRAVRQLKIYDGVTILNNAPREGKSLERFSDDLTLRKKQVSEQLWDQASELLQNSELEISYGGEDEESRALGDAEESRSGKKKQIKKKMKMLMPLLMLLKAKAIAAAILFLGIIALSVFKLAAIAKIAFIAKLLSILKMLLAKKHQDDHGWAPAQEEHGHGHGGWESQGWGRSRNEAADLAYAAYKQQ